MIAVDDVMPKDWELTKVSKVVENMHEMNDSQANEETIKVLEAVITDIRSGKINGVSIQAFSADKTPQIFLISMIRESQISFFVAGLKRILREYIMQDLALALLGNSKSKSKNPQDLN